MIEKFLPKQMGEEETTAAVRELVASLGAGGVETSGKLWGRSSRSTRDGST